MGKTETKDAAVAQKGLQRRGISPVVYLLELTIFALTTSEFMVAGMMPALSTAFGASVAEIGYLISLYALGMAVGAARQSK